MEKPEFPADQVCEPDITSMPVGVLVELDAEEWLIDWETEVTLPTLPTHEPTLPLVPSWTDVCSSPLTMLIIITTGPA